MTEQNFFNLDKPYRVALLSLVSVVTFFLGAEFWENRRQTKYMYDISIHQKEMLSLIKLSEQRNDYQDEKIGENKHNIYKNREDIEEIKKKIK